METLFDTNVFDVFSVRATPSTPVEVIVIGSNYFVRLSGVLYNIGSDGYFESDPTSEYVSLPAPFRNLFLRNVNNAIMCTGL